jgi:hypothetical protein
MPKHEGPRLSPPGEDWGGENAGGLEDLVWHDMIGWSIGRIWRDNGVKDWLVIDRPGDLPNVYAPYPEILTG